VTIGVKNNGPAALISTSGGSSAAEFVFTVPIGTETVSVPSGCDGLIKGSDGTYVRAKAKTGLDTYACQIPEDFLGVGASSTVEFGLKINTVTPDATGTVSFHDPARTPTDPPADANPANDRALVIINPSTGGTGGGTGTTLPITGAQTGLLAGLGALLLVGGGAMYLVGRRRRGDLGMDGENSTS
jgi:LPXTG-motif cell wall-anchored protein